MCPIVLTTKFARKSKIVVTIIIPDYFSFILAEETVDWNIPQLQTPNSQLHKKSPETGLFYDVLLLVL